MNKFDPNQTEASRSNSRGPWIHLGMLAVALLLGWIGSHSQLARYNAANRDSMQFWATGRCLVENRNAFDLKEVLKLQQSEGFQEDRAYLSRIPPWTIPVMAPFGLMTPYWTWFVIVMLSAVMLIVATRLCWDLFGDSRTRASDCYLASYLFAPVLACFKSGQIGIFLLFGLLLFLRWYHKRPFLAGAALWLPFVKPHLFMVFGVVGLQWILAERRWRILIGFATAVILSLGTALALDHNLFTHYLANLRGQAIPNEFIPSLAGVFRLLVAPQVFFLQCLPLFAGLLWGLWYWREHREHWVWKEHGITLLLVSFLVSPYYFLPDEVVLLPVVSQATVLFFRKSNPDSVTAYVLSGLSCVLLVMVIVNVALPSGAYAWSGLVWAAWHVLGRKAAPRSLVLGDARAVPIP
jgi:hypothetical protein